MKPFDLERAKAGDPVDTREGVKMTLIHFGVPGEYPIVGYAGSGQVYRFTLQGKYYKDGGHSVNDLFMAPKKVQHWANVYRVVCTGAIFVGPTWASEAKAIENIDWNIDIKKYIKTILIYEEEI